MLSVILVLIVVGVLLWAVNSIIPMDAKIKQILNVVVVVMVVLWLLGVFFPGWVHDWPVGWRR